ncbi:unnamed protein product, partial [Sphacelaria rigidula]
KLRRFVQSKDKPDGPFVPVENDEQAWPSMTIGDWCRYAEERGIALRAKATQEAAAAATAVEPAEQDSSSRGGTPDSFTVNIEHDSSATTATVAAAVPKTGATHAAGLHSGDHGAGGGVGGGDRSDG